MLSSIVVKLTPKTRKIIFPYALGREIRAWIYNLMSRQHPEFSDRLHNMTGAKPFTVSLLAGKRKDLRDRILLDEKNLYWLRITTLTKEIFEILSSGLFSMVTSDEPVKFYDKELCIKQICLSPEEHPMASVTRYEDLKTKEKKKNFTLNFKTPSAFVYGNGIMPLPLPYSIFRSYLIKWNSFCPFEYQINDHILNVIEKSVYPSNYSLSTKILDMKEFKMVGFTGNCTFQIIGEILPEDLMNILTLVLFSFYAGTGTKATIGMGQTVPCIQGHENK